MFITICITLLVYTMVGKTTRKLVAKLRDINWHEKWNQLLAKIRQYGEKVGRVALKPILVLYYAMQSEDLSSIDRCLIYGAIAYLIIPSDVMPAKILGWFGILDDAAVLAFIYHKLEGKITSDVQRRAQNTIDSWFGVEYEVL